MLKLRKNERNDLYMFSRVVTYESSSASLQSFKKTLQNHFEKSPGEVVVFEEHSSFGAVKKCWEKTGCQCFTADIMQTSFEQVYSIR